MQDRANVSADFLELMKQEIIEVIKKYIDVDEGAIDVRMTNKQNEDGTNGAPALYANIPIVSIKDDVLRAKKKEEEKTEVKVDNEDKTEKQEKKDESAKLEDKTDSENEKKNSQDEKNEENTEEKKEPAKVEEKTKEAVSKE